MYQVSRFTLCALALAAGVAHAQPDLMTRLTTTEHQRTHQIKEIQSLRRYTLRNPRWKTDGVMDVRMTWDGASKKRYEILNINAEGMQKRVMLRLLDGEVDAAARQDSYSAITPENYNFVMEGIDRIDGRECRMVRMQPKKKTKYNVEGKACIDLADAAVVRVEGRAAKSVSFFVGRPVVSQDFRKVGGFWFSSRNRSTADVMFLGSTDLLIEYLDYSITPRVLAAQLN